MTNQLIIPCSYSFNSTLKDAKLLLTTEGFILLFLPRFGKIPFSISTIEEHSIHSDILKILFNFSLNLNQSLEDNLYELMQDRPRNHNVNNAKERIKSVFQITEDHQLQLQLKIAGNWKAYQKTFSTLIGMFSRMEKPILYSIAPFFLDKRNATASLNGYLYQVDLALNYWVDTVQESEMKNKCVMLEFGEDVAVVPTTFVEDIENFNNQNYQHKTLLDEYCLIFDQAKLFKKPINFISDCICDIFFYYYTTLQKAQTTQTNVKIVYKFTTSTTIQELDSWKAKGERAKQLLQELVKYSDEKRQKNSNKSRYLREKNDWDAFKAFSQTNKAVDILNQIVFTENKTPEVLSQEIEDKLRKYTMYPDAHILSNFLYGVIKSQLLATRDSGVFTDKMLTADNLRIQIEKIASLKTSNIDANKGTILYEDSDAYRIIQELVQQNEELKNEKQKLQACLEEKEAFIKELQEIK